MKFRKLLITLPGMLALSPQAHLHAQQVNYLVVTSCGTLVPAYGAGSCSVTWGTALNSAPTIVTTPINTPAAQGIMCNTTATPTTTTVAIKCWMTQTTILNLSIITAGLTLSPAAVAPSGTVVQILAIPQTQ